MGEVSPVLCVFAISVLKEVTRRFPGLFVPGMTRHQFFHGRARSDATIEYGHHLTRDGHLYAKFGRMAGDFTSRGHSLGDVAKFLIDLR